eukprot:204159_1
MAEQKKPVQLIWFLSLSREKQRVYTTRWKFAFPEEYFCAKSYISSDSIRLYYNKMTLQENGLSLFVDDQIEYYDQNDIRQKGKIWSFIIEQLEHVESSSVLYIQLKENNNGKVYKIYTGN